MPVNNDPVVAAALALASDLHPGSAAAATRALARSLCLRAAVLLETDGDLAGLRWGNGCDA
jgi:hypothetical protein